MLCATLQVSLNADLNATEEWTIINLTPDAHPIHIHEVMFEVRQRDQFD
jgi:FtsP/CotA-like multicopper oxidase with cupredoxin domain